VKSILIATTNKGKVKEFEALLQPKGLIVKSLLDFDQPIHVEETGTTFRENAILKAETVSAAFGEIVIADDSGLEIDALGGRPGVYSARYAGEDKNDKANIEKVLYELQGVPFEKRTARFRCALALAVPDKETIVVEGTCEGLIIEQPIGENGFGYDPIFYVKEKGKTMAQLSKNEKNEISHRSDALKKLSNLLDQFL
jgi:XTP/dITP diphosphohydrolase